MTKEEAMNMSNEQAVQILIPMRNMMCDQNGCPISGFSNSVFAFDKAIESLSADVAPIRHGRWKKEYGHYKCLLCNGFDDFADNYCPNCGARMDGEKDD